MSAFTYTTVIILNDFSNVQWRSGWHGDYNADNR